MMLKIDRLNMIFIAVCLATICVPGLQAGSILSSEYLQQVARPVLRELTSIAWDIALHVRPTGACTGALFSMATAATGRKAWVLKFLTSYGVPSSGMMYGVVGAPGHYGQCVHSKGPRQDSTGKPKFEGKYCSLFLTLPPELMQLGVNLSVENDDLPEMKLNFGSKGGNVRVGICVPSTCSNAEISGIMSRLASRYKIGATVKGCRTLKDEDDRPPIYYIAMFVFTVLVTLTLLSTLGQMRGAIEPGSIGCMFSLVTNHGYLIAPVSENISRIAFFGGLKAVLAFWVVVCHTYSTFDLSTVYTLKEGYDVLSSTLVQMGTSAGILCITTFFFISGFFQTYGLHSRALLVSLRSPFFVYLMILGRRYLRLIIPAVAIILFGSTIRAWAHGPFTDELFDQATGSYETYLWKVLTCSYAAPSLKGWSHLWYLSIDMQLCLVMTVIALYMIRKPERAYVTAGMCVIFSSSWIVYTTHVKNILAGTVFSVDFRFTEQYITEIFRTSLTHAGDFALGMLSGIIYSHFAGRMRLSRRSRCVSPAICFAVMLFILHAPELLISQLRVPRWIELIFAGVHRALWSLAWGCLILLMATGNLQWLSRLLSAHPLVVLGRLSFCTYLVHFPLIHYFIGTATVPIQVAHPPMIRMAAGNYTLSLALAYLLHVLVEAPLIQLDKLMFGSRQKPGRHQLNGTKRGPSKTDHPLLLR